MVECLKAENVATVFGYPGAAIAPFYNSLSGSGIRHILTRTEQGAGHAANGFARISDRPGVCIATSGPGATNLFTAIATAYSDSIPLIAITGQVSTRQLGRDVFQEVDTTGAAEPFTKYSYLLKSAEDIGRVFKEAFHIASTGRKGPVLIDVPVDIQQQMVNFCYPKEIAMRGYNPHTEEHSAQIRKAAGTISRAKRPLLCIGGGVILSGAEPALQAFCQKNNIPAVSTMMGISAIPAEHPLYFGMLGQSGVKTANTAVRESDLLILVGARVGDRAISHPSNLENGTKIIHIDIDSAEIGKNLEAAIPLVGDAAKIMSQLATCNIHGAWSEWTKHLTDLRHEENQALSQKVPADGFVNPNQFVQALCAQLPECSVYMADVGQNQIWSAKNYTAHGRFLTTGGMGTMGYSIPAAIGAKLAAPEKTVVAVCGDGAFQMSMNELATMRQHGAPIKMVVMRNNVLGMIKEIQQNEYCGQDFAVDLSGSPDFSLIAAAYGIEYACVNSMQAAGKAIKAMLKDDACFLLECSVNPAESTL